MYVRKATQVPANPDPDEDILLDFGMFKCRLVEFVDADGIRTPDESRLVQLFDDPFQIASTRYQVRRSFDSLMRNGLTRRTGDDARRAGLVVVVDNDRRVSNVIPLFADDPKTAA